MAPSPAAGKTPSKAPSTPTKAGKNPESSATPKLGQSLFTVDLPSVHTRQSTDNAKGGASDKADTDSPKLPPRPKAGGTPQTGRSKPPKLGKKADDAKKQAEDTAEESKEKIDPKDNDTANDADNEKDDPAGKVSQIGNETGEDASSAVDTAEDEGDEAVGGAKDAAEGAAEDTEEAGTETAEDTADEGAEGAAGGLADKAAGAKDTAEGATDEAGETAEGAKETAEDAAPEGAEDAVDDTKETAEDAAGEAKDTAEDAAEDAADQAPVDLSILKGLQVGEGGEILDKNGEPLGQVEEGDPEDLVGQTIGDDGEILDEDGDVIGRVSVLPDKAQELANKAKEDLPDVGVLDGLEVGEDGQILGPDGTPLGKLTEGDPKDLAGYTLNEKGEILDEDGDVVGRAEVVPGEAADKLKESADGAVDDVKDAAGGLAPDLSILAGKKVNKKGKILDDEGETIGQLTDDSDPKQCAGKIPNEKGLILNDDGDIIGRVEVVPGEAADEAMKALHPELLEEAKEGAEDAVPEDIPQLPGLDILEGLKVNKKGEVLNEDGEPIARVSEGEISDLAGKKINANGEVVDKDGNVIGKVELIPEAFDVPEAPQLPGLDILEGLKVNKKGEVLNEDGEPIARVSEGEISDLAGKKINANGEVLDKDGNVIGKVELIPEAFDVPEVETEAPKLPGLDILEGLKVNKKGEVVNEDGDAIAKLVEGDLEACKGKKINDQGEVLDAEGNVVGKVELIPEAFPDAVPEEEGPDFSTLEGYKVNKNGQIVNEDGDVLANLVEGEIDVCKGKKVNEKGEVLDAEGNVVGKVQLAAAQEEEEDTGPELPPLSILEGLKCNKAGKIVDAEGNVVGELVEGDPKKLSKSGAELDAEGQFWDGKGHVIGRAVTLPQDEGDEEAPFAGLEGLIVVPDGWVEDENQNKVGILTEGDPKKLVGRAVDEDGDVIDKKGNVVGHADRYEEPEEEEVKIDYSILEGLAVNKQGNVIGPEGVPIGRLVEGNAKELAGRKCDAEGKIWNDSGKVIGQCEPIPEDQREAKPEGPFAGLEGVVVVKDGMVEDEEGNVVGVVTEGDPKKLVGRAVDEDGDIIDKYGNVKGHAEPYEEPEEEVADLSILDGKVVNKSGNVVDEHGTIYGRIAEGNPEELAGKKVDGQGQIWNDNGKVIGQAELLPGGGTQKPEGPFAGWENLVVAKDGMVTDAAGQIVGKLDDESMPDAEKLLGRKVDEDGDIIDKSGNSIGKAIRWTPEEKERRINPMSGHKVNKDGEVRDENGELLGMVTDGHLPTLVGLEVDDNGYVIDNDGNKVGECTLMENLQEDEGPTEEEIKKAHDAEIAKKINNIVNQTIEKMEPICKQITEVCIVFSLY